MQSSLRIFAFFAIFAILSTPLTLALILGRQGDMGPTSTVFVPLYIYPDPGAWDPLYNVIRDYPQISFTVIVNPDSGPGSGPLPDEQYCLEVPNLTAFSNVRVLGYVATTYADRDLQEVKSDIDVYANWPVEGDDDALAVHGIFFDETPQEYYDEAGNYFQQLTDYVRGLSGFAPHNMVVHNPGVLPDSRYPPLADMTVLFESTYDTFEERKDEVFQNFTGHDRAQVCCVIHSVPEDVTGEKLESLVKDARTLANEVFVTHLSEDYYADFGTQWAEFVNLMAS
ncbi:hypothetical protein FQN53_000742 [Emmonsiellopsis sp. PD_33]|nr:hypothetical protein FQN53_000742 [Emmonsiellopsis sp. PD_33]KAK2806965.1 hypothetical protein FQN51_005767 [Onygenales sp. PD_10]